MSLYYDRAKGPIFAKAWTKSKPFRWRKNINELISYDDLTPLQRNELNRKFQDDYEILLAYRRGRYQEWDYSRSPARPTGKWRKCQGHPQLILLHKGSSKIIKWKWQDNDHWHRCHNNCRPYLDNGLTWGQLKDRLTNDPILNLTGTLEKFGRLERLQGETQHEPAIDEGYWI